MDTDEVAAVDKPMVYYDDVVGRYIYRASALMSCQNALMLARTGVGGSLPPDWMQERFDEGHEQEELILKKIERDYGFKPYAQQQEIEINIGKTAMVRGHIDALSVLGPDVVVHAVDTDPIDGGKGMPLSQLISLGHWTKPWDQCIVVVDAKAFAPSTFKEWQKHQFENELGLHYLWQQATYMYAGDFDGIVMAVKDKVSGKVLVYLYSAAWIKKRLPLATIFTRVMWVENHAPLGEVFDQQCSPKQYPCPFYQLHPDNTAVEGDKIVGDEELHRLGRVRQVTKKALEIAQEAMDKAEKDIRDHVGNKPSKGVKFDDMTVGTNYGSHQVIEWMKIAEALECTVEEAKERFTRSVKNDKLTVRITEPKS